MGAAHPLSFVPIASGGSVVEQTSSVIYNGDCVSGMAKLEAESVNMIFADPPYNLSGSSLVNRKSATGGDFYKVNEKWDSWTDVEYAKFTDAWIYEASRVLVDNGAIYVCASYHNIGEVVTSLKKSKFLVKNILVWEKPNAMPNMTRRTFTHSTEFVVWAVKGKNWIFNFEALKNLNPETQRDGSPKMMRDVWRLPVVQGVERLRGEDGRALHPTQKPETLVQRCIEASTNPGHLVLDPFVGSGTTAVVAKRLGRHSIGFETNDTYFKAARSRLGRG
jgi:site-specific DNA-methyltransferase (adenine-specific)/modification methylase